VSLGRKNNTLWYFGYIIIEGTLVVLSTLVLDLDSRDNVFNRSFK